MPGKQARWKPADRPLFSFVSRLDLCDHRRCPTQFCNHILCPPFSERRNRHKRIDPDRGRHGRAVSDIETCVQTALVIVYLAEMVDYSVRVAVARHASAERMRSHKRI